MNLLIALLAAVIGYLLGAISFARMIGRLVAPGLDVTRAETTVAGTDEKAPFAPVSATTVSLTLGPKWGMPTALLDILKVALPTLAFRLLYPGTHYFLIVATTGIVGHVWPIYYRFKGGRGISPIYGGMFVIDFVGAWVTSIGGMLFGLFVFRNFGVSFLAGLLFIIPWLWFRTYDVWYLAYGIAANILFVIAMIPEIKQAKEYRRRGIRSTMEEDLDTLPMGRMIAKIANRFGLLKKT